MSRKDSMLRARLTQRQSDEWTHIDELQAQMSEASVTTSSIARYALEKYVTLYRQVTEPIFIEVSTADATDEDINLYDLISKMLDEEGITTDSSLHGRREFEPVMMRMAR